MSVQAKMTALADQIRILAATGELLGLEEMAEQTAEANGEVSRQAELIRQIQLELEGLSGAGEDLFSSRATGENPVFYRGQVQAVTKFEFRSGAAGELQEA